MGNADKVLCVDDERINLLILQKLLSKKYEVITAENGVKALDIMEQDADIKFVISDMKMPVMSGLEFIREANSRFQNKKYFMLSGYAIDEEIQAALDAKLIRRYFEKPANFEEINKALQENDITGTDARS